MESRTLGFWIPNTAQGIQNPTNNLNPESNFHSEKIWNPVSEIQNLSSRIQDCLGFPYMGQIGLCSKVSVKTIASKQGNARSDVSLPKNRYKRAGKWCNSNNKDSWEQDTSASKLVWQSSNDKRSWDPPNKQHWLRQTGKVFLPTDKIPLQNNKIIKSWQTLFYTSF